MYSYGGLARRSEKQFPYCLAFLFHKGRIERDNTMNFIWLCACGCGHPAPIAKRTRSQRGQIKGQFLRFISGHNANLFDSEEQRRRASFRNPDSLRYSGSRENYVKYKGRHMHRVVAEKILNRPLAPGEIVHHIDGDKWNNDPSNLQVMTQSEHIKLHLHFKGSKGQ
jgi:hypothetical protein